jgi:hypothetical protein
MKHILMMLATVGAMTVFAVGDGQAAPVGPASVGSGSNIVLVAQFCGRGWHRGPYGGCRRNLSRRWPCWWVHGPYGRWRLICR